MLRTKQKCPFTLHEKSIEDPPFVVTILSALVRDKLGGGGLSPYFAGRGDRRIFFVGMKPCFSGAGSPRKMCTMFKICYILG